jgi:hypothetical protein
VEDEKTGVFVPKKLSVRDRRDDVWIAKLRRQNCFEVLVQKLTDGEPVTVVARWLHDLNPEGELKDCSYETLRHYVGALGARVKANLKFIERQDVEPLAFRFVMNELQKQKVAVVDGEPVMTETAKKIWKVVTDAVKHLDSQTMLKYCFLVQQQRVETLLKMEDQVKMLLPDGWKNLAVLKDIAAEYRKHEIGEQYLKGKGVLPYSSPVQGGLVPHENKELSAVAQLMSQFDATDRNLMREATVRVIELIQEEMRGV